MILIIVIVMCWVILHGMVRGALELVWLGGAQSPRSGVVIENVAAILCLTRCKDLWACPSILKSRSAVKFLMTVKVNNNIILLIL